MSTNQMPDQNDLDKWFAELEAEVDKAEVSRLAQAVIDRHNNREPTLEEKVLADFHGHAPIIESEYDGQLPNLTAKAKMYILIILNQVKCLDLAYQAGVVVVLITYLMSQKKSKMEILNFVKIHLH